MCTHPDHNDRESCLDRTVGCSKDCECCMGPPEDRLENYRERCENCGGLMQWCQSCNCWTKTCCVQYGTCFCS